ncbi:TIGR03620 family F420-dependent LLM class oxidoreductase [Reyranella sp. CPCC 100927]|uniref:TIGR03620 family F420-dependent LLM class oxidoreductase n=1 Tax=Reyranella sp. CPCC 100927 TaxID=2599616 RepID=UPI0011B5DDE9|nr:TIGR03620 family F420-dependent LLM class oxidoreductase [Reyranella sp. CPCC 100927]TWS99422.1 TIGR03620 family F420-dependent LLM class oxidoreductase [Reyranella sp. CPCC 100927]
MALGRLGVWYPVDRLDGPGLRTLLKLVEGSGYSAFWYPESAGYESLALGGFLLQNSQRLMVGSSIANIYARDPYTARRGLATLNGLYDNRFILGLGVSHIPLVEGLRGHRYDKPIPAMRAYLDGITKDQRGAEDWPIVLAALRPKMLELSAKRTRGAVPYNVTPEHTAQAAKVLGPSKWLAVEQKVTLETDQTKARALGRKELARYLVLPNYRNSWLEQGFSEDELANGGSDRFIDAMVLWGDADTVRAGLRRHFDAGATHLAIQPVHAEGDIAARDRILTALADT